MPSLCRVLILQAFQVEGDVNVFVPKRQRKAGIYYVQFRYVRNGETIQVLRSTRQTNYDLARLEGARIFANEMRLPEGTAVTTKLDYLSDQVAAISQRLNSLPAGHPDTIALPGALKNKKSLLEAVEEFLTHKKALVDQGELTGSQYDTLKWKNRSFAEFCEEKGVHHVQEISEQICLDWVASRNAKKSLRGYLGDIGNFLNWTTRFPRKWLPENPISFIGKGRKSCKRPEVMPVGVAAELMEFLENEFPQFVAFYAIALFAGVRQDKKDGELKRLAKCVGKDGWSPYLTKKNLVVPHPKVGKDPREFPMSENLKYWITAYPHLEVPSAHMHRKIIKRFNVPFNSMRHTAISAYVISTGNADLACFIFNTSMTMMKRHYVTLMQKDDVSAFYEIRPKRRMEVAVPPLSAA